MDISSVISLYMGTGEDPGVLLSLNISLRDGSEK